MAHAAYQMDKGDNENNLDHKDYLQIMSQARLPPPAFITSLFVGNSGLTGIASFASPTPEGDATLEETVSPFDQAVAAASSATVSSCD